MSISPINQNFLALIKASAPLKQKIHGLDKQLIISLTTYVNRFDVLPLTLESLISQTVKADKIILWISRHEKNLITKRILSYVERGLEIRLCDDLFSYNKIIHSINLFASDFIVTADDDTYYWPTWLEELIDCYQNNGKNNIVAHRVHQVRLYNFGRPQPYSEWHWNWKIAGPSALNVQTGVGGVLYPPKSLHEDASNQELFLKLAPKSDDLWLYWMARKAGKFIIPTGSSQKEITWPDSQKNSLYKNNQAGGNDLAVSKLLGYFGPPWESGNSSGYGLRKYRNIRPSNYRAQHFFREFNGKKILYSYIRKNGCTAFKKLFLHETGVSEDDPNVMQYLIKNFSYRPAIHGAPDYSIFVYRDPVERVLSAFKNKFIQQKNCEDIFNDYLKVTNKDPNKSTFIEFCVKYISKLSEAEDSILDPHVMPQCMHLLPITYNAVINVQDLHDSMLNILGEPLGNLYFQYPENLTKNINTIELVNAHSMTVEQLNEIYKEESRFPDEKSFLNDPKILKIIKKVYENDYLMLSKIDK